MSWLKPFRKRSTELLAETPIEQQKSLEPSYHPTDLLPETQERDIQSVAFGPKGGWFIRWSDGFMDW